MCVWLCMFYTKSPQEAPAAFTASADRHVLLWSADGEEVGHLEQANAAPFNLRELHSTVSASVVPDRPLTPLLSLSLSLSLSLVFEYLYQRVPLCF